MPGYILHLTAARMALDLLQKTNAGFGSPVIQNEFFVGNLLPDTVKNNIEKNKSHFRNPKFRGNMVEYPDLDMFLDKYRYLLGNISCLGYYFHLYIDRRFFKNYLPQIVVFTDENGQEKEKREEIVWAELKGTGQKVSIQDFFSEKYYYGDYTKMNTYLAKRYHLPMDLDICMENPGIEEVHYMETAETLRELQGYLKIPAKEIEELKVFHVEELLEFLRKEAEKFVNKISSSCINLLE